MRAAPFKGDPDRLFAAPILQCGSFAAIVAAIGYSDAEVSMFLCDPARLLRAIPRCRQAEVDGPFAEDLLLRVWSEIEAHLLIERARSGVDERPMAQPAYITDRERLLVACLHVLARHVKQPAALAAKVLSEADALGGVTPSCAEETRRYLSLSVNGGGASEKDLEHGSKDAR